MKRIIILIIFLALVSGCAKAKSEVMDEETPIDSEVRALNQAILNISPPTGYKTFVSGNQKLMFFYKEDWKCNEVVDGMRIDCYPLGRVGEEYDAGLDENIVYQPDISIQSDNELCILDADSEAILKTEKEPLTYNEQGENYYGLFYKKFNDCLTRIITSPDIDTIEKLEEIIK